LRISRTTASYSESGEIPDITVDAYAEGLDTGGARGCKGLSDNGCTGEWMGGASGEYSFVKWTTWVGGFVITGSESYFTTDCTIVRADFFSRTARRTGFGLCGLEKSGTLIPNKVRNNGIMMTMKRMHRLCFTNILIKSTYQIR
jgi:hypothetical protein